MIISILRRTILFFITLFFLHGVSADIDIPLPPQTADNTAGPSSIAAPAASIPPAISVATNATSALPVKKNNLSTNSTVSALKKENPTITNETKKTDNNTKLKKQIKSEIKTADKKSKNKEKAKSKTKVKHVAQVKLPAPTLGVTEGLNSILSKLQRSTFPNVHLGVIVQSMDSGEVLYQYNADQLFTPASVLKLFTATAAINYLKPDYKFTTEMLTDGSVDNGVLTGNLYLRFSGDPTLQTSDITQMFNYLSAKLGVKKITGSIFVDNFAYDNIASPPGCVWDDLSYNYAAPMNAIIIDHNRFALRRAQPNPTNVSNGQVSQKQCPVSIINNNQNVYLIKGCPDPNEGEQELSITVRDVFPYAIRILDQAINRNHIQYTGPIMQRQVPANARLLTSHDSPALSDIVRTMLKMSDNVLTNSIFKKMGQLMYRSQGSWTNGVKAVRELLTIPAQINFNHGLIVDGAGLSRYNLLSPRQLSQLLQYAYHNEIIRNELMRSLPIAGKDGTLKSRMPEEAHGERVHAKTGTMKGVTALAGYLKTEHKGTLSFAIIFNGFSGSKAPYRAMQDRICEFLIRAQ